MHPVVFPTGQFALPVRPPLGKQSLLVQSLVGTPPSCSGSSRGQRGLASAVGAPWCIDAPQDPRFASRTCRMLPSCCHVAPRDQAANPRPPPNAHVAIMALPHVHVRGSSIVHVCPRLTGYDVPSRDRRSSNWWRDKTPPACKLMRWPCSSSSPCFRHRVCLLYTSPSPRDS